jgi:hypothetical protein
MTKKRNFKKLSFDDKKFLEKFNKLPINNYCPLIENKKWYCGKFEKGGEKFCKEISGYIGCPRFQKWFWYWVKRYVAEGIIKKKKCQKEK